MSRVTVGPMALVDDRDLDERLPRPNSLRRASDDAKRAVVAATEALQAAGLAVTERVGLYVGFQRSAMDYTVQFVEGTYRDGPRMASPMLFTESVLNSTATHLSLTLGFRGVVQTFVGSRCAGIQAVIAARDDIEAGVVDAGLVAVLSSGHRVTSDAYKAVYRSREEGAVRQEASAFVLRAGAGPGAALAYARVACFGRTLERKLQAVRHLWDEYTSGCAPYVPPKVRELAERFGFAASSVTLSALSHEQRELIFPVGSITGGGGSDTSSEFFALHPINWLAAGWPVVCVSEEGTVGLIALDGPLS
jgi:hypothetical protein